MEEALCSYDSCNEPVNSPHDETLCIFHAPVEKKGKKLDEFNELIWRRINGRCFNFKGFIFPGDIYFLSECKKMGGHIAISGPANFSYAIFTGKVSFNGVQFRQHVNLKGTQFLGESEFQNAIFSMGADYSNAKFTGPSDFFETKFDYDTNFLKVRFLNSVSFVETQFSGQAWFILAKFKKFSDFAGTKFKGDADFTAAEFWHKVDFNIAVFENRAIFESPTIAGELTFDNITLLPKSRFYFKDPRFVSPMRNMGFVVFNTVQFNPFAAYFENIKQKNDTKRDLYNLKARLIFRYCQLKDIYFTNNNMSLFSFYKSSFDEARIISSNWSDENDRVFLIPFKRKNVIPEERFLIYSSYKEQLMIEDLNGYEDVASLYRHMKTALDYTKDYQQASWFYFNEFEMKRRAIKEQIEKTLPKWKILQGQPLLFFHRQLKKIFSRYIFYFSYKVFAGFGEKPLWSFYWFLLGILGFTALNYCIGLKKGITLPGGTIDYVDATFWDSLIFTLYRIIPVNYLPFKLVYDIPYGLWGMLVPFLNTAVLIIFIAFIAIGLKRHFRRF